MADGGGGGRHQEERGALGLTLEAPPADLLGCMERKGKLSDKWHKITLSGWGDNTKHIPMGRGSSEYPRDTLR